MEKLPDTLRQPSQEAASTAISEALAQRAVSGDFYTQTIASGYDRLVEQCESGQTSPYHLVKTPDIWDSGHAAICSYAVHGRDEQLMADAIQAMHAPDHIWRAAAWASHHGAILPERTLYLMADVRAEATPTQMFGIELANLAMNLNSYSAETRQGHAESVAAIAEALNALKFTISNAEAFPPDTAWRYHLEIARTLRDAGWLRAAADVRSSEPLKHIDAESIKAFDETLHNLRGRFHRFRPDPRPASYTAAHLTLDEGWDDLARHTNMNTLAVERGEYMGVVDTVPYYGGQQANLLRDIELSILMENYPAVHAYVGEAFAPEYPMAYRSTIATALHAAVLLDTYRITERIAPVAAVFASRTEAMIASLDFNPDHTAVHRGNARMRAQEEMVELAVLARQLATPGDRLAALRTLKELSETYDCIDATALAKKTHLNRVMCRNLEILLGMMPSKDAQRELEALRIADQPKCMRLGSMCLRGCRILCRE